MIRRIFTATFFTKMLILQPILSASPVPFTEEAYALPAPQEMVDFIESIAQSIGFTELYEVAIPKKSGIQINPWNKFIGSGIHPVTKRPFFIINPEWFNALSADEQAFFITQHFMRLHEGILPLSLKILPYLYILLSILLIMGMFIGFGYTPLRTRSKWLRLMIAVLFAGLCEPAFLNRLYAKLQESLLKTHRLRIDELALEKTQNKDAAIRALNHLNACVNQELNNGELFFAPYATLFAEEAESLQ